MTVLEPNPDPKKAMSHYGDSRATYAYRLLIEIAHDRKLDYDYRIKTRSYEKPAMFRRDDAYLQPDYRHTVSHLRFMREEFLFFNQKSLINPNHSAWPILMKLKRMFWER